jgi:hypothetical protein
MDSLHAIPGIGKSSLELLEAAGFLSVDSLANAGVDELAAELERANAMLQILKKTPSRTLVESWVNRAREITGVPTGIEAAPRMPVDYEKTPQGAAMLNAAPFAIPLPARILVAGNLAVSEIPPAILLNRYSGDLDVRTGQRIPEIRHAKANNHASSGNFVRLAESSNSRLEIDTSRLRSTGDLGEPKLRTASVKTSPANDRVALIRAPRTETNKGRNPESRRYIRGVLHSHPHSITAGALVTLLALVTTPLAVISALLLLLSGEFPVEFSWVPGWLIVFPLVLPFFGICYLIWGFGGRCRICGQSLFRHRHHRKNSRAHRMSGLGYILPLCIHILLFRWFRCTHCGTPVRLKE